VGLIRGRNWGHDGGEQKKWAFDKIVLSGFRKSKDRPERVTEDGGTRRYDSTSSGEERQGTIGKKPRKCEEKVHLAERSTAGR